MDDGDFRKLILAELDAVYRLACHLTRERNEADDVVQETYLRALRSADTFSLANFGVRPWLFKILHNVISTRGANAQRERDATREQRASAPKALDLRSQPQALSMLDWEDVDERLKAAIAELGLPYRATFLLSAVEGLKYREIADVTGVPVGTVMSRLSRARDALATRLADLAAEQRLGNPVEKVSNEGPATA